MGSITEEMNEISKELHNKAISHVELMSKQMALALGFYVRPMIIIFFDGTWMFAQTNKKGTDAGVINYQNGDKSKIISYAK